MTLKEAETAAEKMLPVSCKILISAELKKIKFKRITRTGYFYAENGVKQPFVELYDAGSNSVIYADPDDCEILKEKE